MTLEYAPGLTPETDKNNRLKERAGEKGAVALLAMAAAESFREVMAAHDSFAAEVKTIFEGKRVIFTGGYEDAERQWIPLVNQEAVVTQTVVPSGTHIELVVALDGDRDNTVTVDLHRLSEIEEVPEASEITSEDLQLVG